jgi:hypothetical protein
MADFENFGPCDAFIEYDCMQASADRAREDMYSAETHARHVLYLRGLKVQELNDCQENLHPRLEAYIEAKNDALHAVKETMRVALGAAAKVKAMTKIHANAKAALSRCESECREQLKRMETEVTSGDKQTILDNLEKRLEFLSLPQTERSGLTKVHMVMPWISNISKFGSISAGIRSEIGKDEWPQTILPLVCKILKSN